MAYHHRDLIGTFDSALGRRTLLIVSMPLLTRLGSSWQREIRFPAIKTSGIRPRSGTVMDSDLRSSEFRFVLGAAEVSRQPFWRSTAFPNPWGVQYPSTIHPLHGGDPFRASTRTCL
jgi:hypothetical protein